MDLVVVWWSFAVTGSSSGADCHLGLVVGHLMDLVVRVLFFVYVYVFVCVCVFCIYIYICI